MTVDILVGDWLTSLATLDDQRANCCVTSPPYFGLRDYGVVGQLGLERTPDEYVDALVVGFREVRRVLCNDGTLWLNLGDSYATAGTRQGHQGNSFGSENTRRDEHSAGYRGRTPGLKNKDLLGIPWMVAFALRKDGWYLRSDIIWSKPNPMPESVTDRPTKAHEYLFLLSQSANYYYDAAAIRAPLAASSITRLEQPTLEQQEGSHRVPGKTNGTMKAVRRTDKQRGHARRHAGFNDRWDAMSKEEQQAVGANKRSVWIVATQPFKGAHFATFPPNLVEPCILAGCPRGGLVLDPFGGAGTTGLVADRLGRNAILCEINPAYADMARERIQADNPLGIGVA